MISFTTLDANGVSNEGEWEEATVLNMLHSFSERTAEKKNKALWRKGLAVVGALTLLVGLAGCVEEQESDESQPDTAPEPVATATATEAVTAPVEPEPATIDDADTPTPSPEPVNSEPQQSEKAAGAQLTAQPESNSNTTQIAPVAKVPRKGAETAAKKAASEKKTATAKAPTKKAATKKAPAKKSSQQAEPRKKPAGSVYYKNCSAAKAAGAAPVYRGDPGYGKHLDRDGDGVGCER